MSGTWRASIVKGIGYAFLCVASFLMVYPLLYMALGAFTTRERLQSAWLLPIPNTLNLQIFRFAWENGVWQAYAYTLVRAMAYVAAALLFGLIGGYVFSKLRFPGRNKLFLLFLSGMTMPAILMILPMFLMMAKVPLAGGNDIFGKGGHGLIGEWPVLFVFGWVQPFAIFLLKQSFDMLPTEYQDAAKMDGAGIFTIIFRVYGPLLKPPLMALATITFLGVWNDYLWPSLTITRYTEYLPITLRLLGVGAFGSTGGGGGSLSPGLLLFTLLVTWPPAVVYLVLQRYLVQGLVSSGLKG